MADLSEQEKEDIRTEQRRMWCLSQAINVAVAVAERAPKAPTLDIMHTAEEMAEFIETGVARTAKVARTNQ